MADNYGIDTAQSSGLSTIDTREYTRSGGLRGSESIGPSFKSQLADAMLPIAQTANQIWGKQVIGMALTTMGGAPAGSPMGMGGGVFGSAGAGVFGGRSSITGPGGSVGGGGGVPFGPPPAPPGMGGSTVSSASGIPGMGGSADYQTQLDSMFNNNMMFLMLQTKVQNMSQQIQLTSNTIKAKDDAIANTIRNFRS